MLVIAAAVLISYFVGQAAADLLLPRHLARALGRDDARGTYATRAYGSLTYICVVSIGVAFMYLAHVPIDFYALPIVSLVVLIPCVQWLAYERNVWKLAIRLSRRGAMSPDEFDVYVSGCAFFARSIVNIVCAILVTGVSVLTW